MTGWRRSTACRYEEYEYLIENQSDELAAYAAEKAVALRKQVYGTDVYIRRTDRNRQYLP